MCTVCTPCQATTMPIHLKDGTYLQITFMKYDKYCPRILGDKAENTLFHIFFPQSQAKRYTTQKTTPACMITWGSPFPNMNVIHEYLPLLDPILWRMGAKMYPIWILTFKVAQGQIQ